MYDFLSEFDDAVISGHVGAVKPDPRIYEILFERVGRRPQRTAVHRRLLKPTSRRRGGRHAGDPLPPRRRSRKRTRRPRRPALSQPAKRLKASVTPILARLGLALSGDVSLYTYGPLSSFFDFTNFRWRRLN